MLTDKPDISRIFGDGVQVTRLQPAFARTLRRLIETVEMVPDANLHGSANPEMRYCAAWLIDSAAEPPVQLKNFADQFAASNFASLVQLYPGAEETVSTVQVFRSHRGYELGWHDHLDHPSIADTLIYFSDEQGGTEEDAALEIGRVTRDPETAAITGHEVTARIAPQDGLVAIIDNLTPCFQHRVERQTSDAPRWLVVFRIGRFR